MRLATCVRCWAVAGALACGVVYPEIATPTRAVPKNAELEPAPPEDVIYIEVAKAEIPKRTRDGREWDAVGGSLPDPFLILFVEKEELFRTPVQENTLSPTWPDAQKGNYRIPEHKRVRLELWDSNALTHRPIGVSYIDHIHQQAGYGLVDVNCDSGARASLIVEPGRAVLGLGLYYELRAEEVYVTRVLEESPASRLGLEAGVEIIAIQDRPVRGMDVGEVRSLINANARSGVTLKVKRLDGQNETVVLKEGPVYPLVHERVDLE